MTEAPAAERMGRLFFTAEQRAQLDIARARHDPRAPVVSEPEILAAPALAVPRGPGVVTYSGVVRRGDGKSTVWINGKPVTERNRAGASAGEVSVLGMREDGAVSIAVPQASRTASLKVGQSLDVNSGRIDESYTSRPGAPSPSPQTQAEPAPPLSASSGSLENRLKSLRTLRDTPGRDTDARGDAATAQQPDKR
ncbi:MAG: hypothetical protein FJY56_09120 [Betaproteobacteria bacterium]|nr:hypothetical protein [Betaproteobacteria bacterium]